MTEYFKVADEVDRLIKRGLAEMQFIDEFSDAIERLSVARAFFADHNDVKASASALSRVEGSMQV